MTHAYHRIHKIHFSHNRAVSTLLDNTQNTTQFNSIVVLLRFRHFHAPQSFSYIFRLYASHHRTSVMGVSVSFLISVLPYVPSPPSLNSKITKTFVSNPILIYSNRPASSPFRVLFNPHGFEPTRCPRDALTGPASCEPFPRSPPFSSLKHGILKWHQIFS